MKRLFAIAICAVLAISVSTAQTEAPKVDYVDATQLTLLGKLCETTNPYHRVEVATIPELNKSESRLLRQTSGLAVAFKTDASAIYVKAKYGTQNSWGPTSPLSATTGFNLFIKDETGEFVWAASKAHKMTPLPGNLDKMSRPIKMIANLYEGEKECIIYLPLASELTSVEIGVTKGSSLEPLGNPFRHKIAVFGSSFTQGASASGSGLTWPAFFSRSTGLYVCSMGISGNCRLQPYLGDVIGKSGADALVCDAFSNPTIAQISERIRPFIESVRKHSPKMPIIFLNTIYRENRKFQPRYEMNEQKRIEFVEETMAKVVKEYKNVYFVNVPNQTGTDHVTSADGVHPYSYGYHRWAQAIEKPVMKILKKHKIK